MVLMNVMAHSKNRNTSTNSVRLCRAACVTSDGGVWYRIQGLGSRV
jgi:hypothetical protein